MSKQPRHYLHCSGNKRWIKQFAEQCKGKADADNRIMAVNIETFAPIWRTARLNGRTEIMLTTMP